MAKRFSAAPVPTVTPTQAATTVRVDDDTARRVATAVGSFVDSLARQARLPNPLGLDSPGIGSPRSGRCVGTD